MESDLNFKANTEKMRTADPPSAPPPSSLQHVEGEELFRRHSSDKKKGLMSSMSLLVMWCD